LPIVWQETWLHPRFENNLVDGLLYRDGLIDTLKALTGIAKEKDLNLVSMSKYTKVPDPKQILFCKKPDRPHICLRNYCDGQGQ